MFVAPFRHQAPPTALRTRPIITAIGQPGQLKGHRASSCRSPYGRHQQHRQVRHLRWVVQPRRRRGLAISARCARSGSLSGNSPSRSNRAADGAARWSNRSIRALNPAAAWSNDGELAAHQRIGPRRGGLGASQRVRAERCRGGCSTRPPKSGSMAANTPPGRSTRRISAMAPRPVRATTWPTGRTPGRSSAARAAAERRRRKSVAKRPNTCGSFFDQGSAGQCESIAATVPRHRWASSPATVP